ncbi:MAG: hypothetical protein ACQPRJ_04305 [Solitalea-like symbiont of Acarus siro]
MDKKVQKESDINWIKWAIAAAVALFIIVLISVYDISVYGILEEGIKKEAEEDTSIADSMKIHEEQIRKDSLKVINKAKYNKALKDLKNFRVQKDKFEDSEFYSDKRTPKYSNENFIYPYIGRSDDHVWLRLKYQYASEDWLFINKAILLVDGVKYEIYGTWERDHNTSIWEWFDSPVTYSEIFMLEEIANSKSAKIRYIGTQYHKDRVITKKEKSIIKNTLEVFDGLKSKP